MVTVADTAYSIAEVRAEEASQPPGERLFDDPFAAIFACAGEHAREGTERFLALPGFREGVRLRTRHIDDEVRAGLDAGLEQIVILGAGFDARALRMSEIAARAVPVYEVDFAEQLDRKRRLLEAAGVAVRNADLYVPCDFMRPDFDTTLESSLRACGFRPGAGAVFVWEGVIGYIDRPAIEKSLSFMRRAGGARTRVVFTSGFMAFDPESADVVTRRLGYSSCNEVKTDVLWRRHLKSEPYVHAHVSSVCTATV
jgi:methyltransferase (TIGR00027 family)